MKTPNSKYRPSVHVFVCVNERDKNSSLPSCSNASDATSGGGLDVFNKFRELVAQRNLSSKIWITQTKCLTFCNKDGVTVVVYPFGEWFTEVKTADVGLILNSITKDSPEQI